MTPYKDPEIEKEFQRNYYQEHKEEMDNRAKTWKEKHPEQTKEFRKKWQKNHPEKFREYQKKYAKNNPEKEKAHKIASQFPIGSRCLVCGSTENLERAHFDYSKPEEFFTLCCKHHKLIDKYYRSFD